MLIGYTLKKDGRLNMFSRFYLYFGRIGVAVTCLLGFYEVCSLCTPGRLRFVSPDNSTCYAVSYFDQITTWHGAVVRCQEENGRLAEINSQQQDEIVKTILSGPTILPMCYWIGINDIKDEGVYRLTNGSKAPYVKMSTNPFVSFLNRFQDCVVICKDLSGSVLNLWQSNMCFIPQGYICRKDVSKPTRESPKNKIDSKVPTKALPKETVFKRLPYLNGYKIGSKPDMEKRTHLPTMCARECMKVLSPCQLFNYHSTTRSCLGFSSANVLVVDNWQTIDDQWTVWKMFYI